MLTPNPRRLIQLDLDFKISCKYYLPIHSCNDETICKIIFCKKTHFDLNSKFFSNKCHSTIEI